jgi:hypothetical protein
VALFHCPPDEFAVVFLSNLARGYEFPGDQGVPASLYHEVVDRAAAIYLAEEETPEMPRIP